MRVGGTIHMRVEIDTLVLLEQLAGRAEVADVGHARADEHLVHRRRPPPTSRRASSGSFGAQTIGLRHFREVDLDHRGVLGVRIGAHQRRVLQPLLHFPGAALERTRVTITLGNHAAQQNDVGAQILGHRCPP
jgi:hypothetical protein